MEHESGAILELQMMRELLAGESRKMSAQRIREVTAQMNGLRRKAIAAFKQRGVGEFNGNDSEMRGMAQTMIDPPFSWLRTDAMNALAHKDYPVFFGAADAYLGFSYITSSLSIAQITNEGQFDRAFDLYSDSDKLVNPGKKTSDTVGEFVAAESLAKSAAQLLKENPTGIQLVEKLFKDVQSGRQPSGPLRYSIPAFLTAGAQMGRDLYRTSINLLSESRAR